MGERQRGRDPNKYHPKEENKEELPLYHQAARYPDEVKSLTPYTQVQQVIYETPCDLSGYRLMLQPDLVWHVAVLGTPPSDELHRRLVDILSTGEPVTLPDDVLLALNQRRKEQSQIAPWVERHYRPRRRTRK